MSSADSISAYLDAVYQAERWPVSAAMASGLWLEKYYGALEGQNVAVCMSLLHPMHYQNRAGHPLESLLQPSHSRGLRLPDVWGDCQLHVVLPNANCTRSAEVNDHWWPFSLGGATAATNSVRLCSTCNAMKAHSVVLWPWEWPLPNWATERLRQLEGFKKSG